MAEVLKGRFRSDSISLSTGLVYLAKLGMDAYRQTATKVAGDTHKAARAWAAKHLGAPRAFDELITGVEEKDEVLTRLATEIHRREPFEQRSPGPGGRMQRQRMHPSEVDPWAVSLSELQERSEYLDTCAHCAGAGKQGCGNCGQSGRTRCGTCSGSGKVWKHQKNGGKNIQCAGCHGAGTNKCGACGGSGTITCCGCAGSGHERAWCAYTEQSRTLIDIYPDSPILGAHPQLTEAQLLASGDLGAFLELAAATQQGPLNQSQLEPTDREFLAQRNPPTDRKLERVSRQQLLRFGVPRRDVSYELCGAKGTLVLSGTTLAGTSSREALRPIRTRLIAWGAMSAALAILIWIGAASTAGTTVYSERSNSEVSWIALVAILFVVVAVGGLTRALRPGFKFRKFRSYEMAALAGVAAAAVAMTVVRIVSHPTVAEARAAVAKSDLTRAQIVVDALKSAQAGSTDVSNVQDELDIAKAGTLKGKEKLDKLDAVAAAGRASAGAAARDARAARAALVEAALGANKADDAQAVLSTWPKRSDDDPTQVGELQARTYELQLEQCSVDICRWTAARNSAAAAPTAARTERVTSTRSALIADLTFVDKPGEPEAERLHRVATAGALGSAIGDVAGDNELAAKAKSTTSWAQSERGKVALIGSDNAVVAELLGVPAGGPAANHATVSSVGIYWAVDPANHCKGVYLTGDSKGARTLDDAAHGAAAAKLLGQALGHAMSLPAAPKAVGTTTPSITNFRDGTVAIAARWHNGQLIELRIGDATP